MPAQTKRYYSVKETATLMGVSTNTVYTYLDSGKIKAKRIGNGRFKIPFFEIEPYLNSQTDYPKPFYQPLSGINQALIETTEAKTGSDFAFWRVYKAYFLIAIGVIYLFWRPN